MLVHPFIKAVLLTFVLAFGLMTVATASQQDPFQPVAQAQCSQDEIVLHWLNVNLRDTAGKETLYHVFLFVPTTVNVEEQQRLWQLGDSFSKGASGSLIIAPDGQSVSDPEIIGRVFMAALNLCYLKQQHALNAHVIDPTNINQVLLSRDANLMMLFETFWDRMVKLKLDADSYEAEVHRDTFLQVLPRISEARLSSAALMTAMKADPKTFPFLIGCEATPALVAEQATFEAFINARGPESYKLQRVMEIQSEDWQTKMQVLEGAKLVLDVAKYRQVVIKSYQEKRSLELDLPALKTTSDWLTQTKAPMGAGMNLAMVDSRDTYQRLLDAVTEATVTWLLDNLASGAQQKMIDLLVKMMMRDGLDPVGTRFFLSAGTAVGFDSAREAFNTAGIARSLRICASSAEIEKRMRDIYALQLRTTSEWDRTAPPSADQLEARVWLHRIQLSAASTFYAVLGNTLSSEENLASAVRQLELDGRKITWNDKYDRCAREYLGIAANLQTLANYVVPDSKDSVDVWSHLLQVYRSPATPYEVIDLGETTSTDQFTHCPFYKMPGITRSGKIAPLVLKANPNKSIIVVDGKNIETGCPSIFYAFNDHEQICTSGNGIPISITVNGNRYNSKTTMAYLYQQGKLEILPPGKYNETRANDINSKGSVVGCAGNRDPREPGTTQACAILWEEGCRSQPLDLGLPAGRFNTATAINDRNQIIGYAEQYEKQKRFSVGYFWDKGKGTWITGLGGNECQPTDINDHSLVVGWSTTAAGRAHAFTWTNGVTTDLGSLYPQGESKAWAVNNAGIAVGQSQNTNNPYDKTTKRAIVWIHGKLQDLNSLIGDQAKSWQLLCANGINDAGSIVGLGLFNGAPHFFLAVPKKRSEQLTDLTIPVR